MDTVRGRYELSTAGARQELRSLGRSADSAERSVKRLGQRLDGLGKQTVLVRRLRTEFRSMAREASSAERTLTRTMRAKTREVEKQIGAVKLLRRELRALNGARVRVDVEGIDAQIAKVELLIRKLKHLDRMRVRTRVSTPGAGPGAVRAGGTGSDASDTANLRSTRRAAEQAGDALGRAGSQARFFGVSLRTIAAASVVALPAIQSLIGALGALGGSLAQAGLGAGAIGIAGGGALTAGIGGIASVAKPTISGIRDVFKAQSTLQQSARQQRLVNAATGQSTLQLQQRQEALTNAQEQATQAQKDLTQARRDAVRTITDLRFANERAAISEGKAALAQRQARRDLQRALNDPLSSRDQIEEARLNLRSANLDVNQSRVDRRRSRVDYRRARRKGVRGADNVQAAQRAVRDAGRSIRDARAAQREAAGGGSSGILEKAALQDALRKAPQGTQELLREAKQFKDSWRGATKGAQGDLVALARRGVLTGKRLEGALAGSAKRSTGALLREGNLFGDFLESKVTRRFIRDATAMFDENLGDARRTTQNFLTVLMQITRASRPFLREMMHGLRTMTDGWRRNSMDTDSLRDKIGGLVDQTRKWWRLTRSAWHLLRDLGSAGAPAGGGLVDSLTRTFDRWDLWVKTHPERVQRFFEDTANSTRKMASALARIVGALSRLADRLRPILDLTTSIAGVAGPLLATPGGMAAAFGAYGALRGRGRGGGGGGILGGLLGGNAMRRGAAARGAGGVSGAGGMLARGGGALSLGLRGASRAAWPIAALFAAGTFAGTHGTFGERAQNTLSSLSFGLIPGAETRAQSRGRGQSAAGAVLGRGLGAVDQRIATLRASLAARNPRRGRSFGGGHKLHGDARDRAEAQLQALLAGRGGVAAGSLISAYGMTSQYGSQGAAGRNALSSFKDAFEKGGTEARRVLVTAISGWTAELEHGTKAQRRLAAQLKQDIVEKYRSMGRSVRIVNGQISELTDTAWGKIVSTIQSQGARASGAARQSFSDVEQAAFAQLRAMGYGPSEARLLIRGSARNAPQSTRTAASALQGGQSYSTAQTTGRETARGHATGGRLGGRGLQDTLSMPDGSKAAPGELVVNRHTEMRLARKGVNLAAEVAGEKKPHSAPIMHRPQASAMAMRVMRDKARGGRIVPIPGQPGESIFEGLVPSVTKLIRAYGLRVTDGYGTSPPHAPNSDHLWGGAIDVVPAGGAYGSGKGDWASVAALANWAEPRQGQPRPPFRWVGWNGDPGHGDPAHAGGNAHLHLSWSKGHYGLPSGGRVGGATGDIGLGGGAGGGTVSLRGVNTGLGGVPGGLANAASAAYARGLQRKINRRLNASGGGGGDLSGISGGGDAEANMRLGRRMMMRFGYGANQWPALKALWTGESGWRTTADNPTSDAYGIPQSLPGSKMASEGADWRTNPATQIAWGLKYIKGRYGTPSSAYAAWQARSPHWYARGGRMAVPDFGGWFKRGGSATFRGPTMVGVGDGQATGGSETIHVTRNAPGARPGGAGGAGTVAVTMNFGDVSVGSEVEFEKMVEKAAEAVGFRLLEELERQSG